MKLLTIRAGDIGRSLRFDSKFHVSKNNALLSQMSSGRWPMKSIAEIFGKQNVWTGDIFTRVYASDLAHGKPLLVPYDLFRYVPWSDKILSESQVNQFSRLQIKRGWMFIVCSGRNLGPITIADKFCEQFTMSHDMVRISAELSDDLFYAAAFLSTTHGQATIRTDMNGSVIDHTDQNQIAALKVPVVDPETRGYCANQFRVSFEKRERARLLLAETQAAFLARFGLTHVASANGARRFSIARSSVVDRIDAEPNAPRYEAIRKKVLRAGGARLSDIAHVTKPFGRYKTNYVSDPAFGMPMLNGRQISQYRPIGLRHMALAAFKKPESYRLAQGTTLLTADGRAEENLADCALVTEDRAGWGASGHVYRVVPNAGVNPGLVYLACSCAPSQAQLKALATGSVVDALNQPDVESIVVPFGTTTDVRALGDDATRAWRLFAQSFSAEQDAIKRLESRLDGFEAADIAG